MNKQRKVLITVTYNENGVIIDTKAEEVAQPNLQPTCNQLGSANRYDTDRLAIETAPSADVPHWIPCNERLPEELLPVLVAVREKDRKAAWATEKSWHYVTAISALDGGAWDYYGDQVAAWIPLPEPYKGGDTNE